MDELFRDHILDHYRHPRCHGTIEHAEGYQTTIEGITFTLEGEGLDQVVGQTEEIQGRPDRK